MESTAKTVSDIFSEKIKRLCSSQASSEALQDEYGLFVPPSGSFSQFSQHTFDLTGAVEEFLESPEKQVLLLLGDSGSGKSLFSQRLIIKKAQQHQTGQRIPLFISLPTLRNPKNQLLQEFFKRHNFTSEEIEQLRRNHQFIFILDAYDETNILENFYLKNKLDEWQAKVIITCRTSYLVHVEDYKKLFMPYKGERAYSAAYHELYVAPFMSAQIELYVKQYVEVKREELEKEILARPELTKQWLNPKHYEHWIENIDGLKGLVKTAFYLRITMEVLPNVVSEFQTTQNEQQRLKMTQAKLYDAFIKRIFAREEDKIIARGDSSGRNFQKYCLGFAKSLAKKMHERHLTSVQYEEAVADNPFDEPESAPPEDYKQWAIYFSTELLPEDNGSNEKREIRINARKACPIRKVGANQYAFIHASLLEYFVAEVMKDALIKQTVNKPSPPSTPPTPKLSARQAQGNRRTLGEFVLMEELTREEANALYIEEGIKIDFNPNENTKSVVLGKGQFGAFHIGRNQINHRFAGIKIITEKGIAASKKEAEVQMQLMGLSNLMPLWHTEETENPATLFQVMPLAGFGNGELLRDLFSQITDTALRKKLLAHTAKGLLMGTKNMHTRRVYHLDLKPANFVIDYRGIIYIIDFGCAVREYSSKEDSMLTDGNGDIRYFSPERIAHWRHYRITNKGDKVTGPGGNEIQQPFDAVKADAWAIGLALLEILRGKFPIRMSDATRAEKDFLLNEWCKPFFMKSFQRIVALPASSTDLIGSLLQALLAVDPAKRLTPRDALTLPIFTHPDYQITPDELKMVISQLVQLKLNRNAAANISQSSVSASGAKPAATASVNSSYVIPNSNSGSVNTTAVEIERSKVYAKEAPSTGNYIGDISPNVESGKEVPILVPPGSLKGSPVFGNIANKPSATVNTQEKTTVKSILTNYN